MLTLLLTIASFSQPATARSEATQAAHVAGNAWSQCVGLAVRARLASSLSAGELLSQAEASCPDEERAALRAIARDRGIDPDRMTPNELIAIRDEIQAPSRPVLIRAIEGMRRSGAR